MINSHALIVGSGVVLVGLWRDLPVFLVEATKGRRAMGVPVDIVLDKDVYNSKYAELCKGLNLDKNASDRAWSSYLAVKEDYSLDVSFCLYWGQYFVCSADYIVVLCTAGRSKSLVGLCHLCGLPQCH